MLRWLSNKYFFIFIIVVIAFAALIFSKYYYAQRESSPESILTPGHPPVSQVPTFTATSTMPKTKIYRNEEWGFEFGYPKNWKLEENSFYSPFSKFNLQGDLSAENYNPFSPLFIINIVTPDFADRAFNDLKNTVSEVNVAGIIGLKYEYEYEGLLKIAIVLPFGQYKMILGADRDHKGVFNQILASFKFLK